MRSTDIQSSSLINNRDDDEAIEEVKENETIKPHEVYESIEIDLSMDISKH